MLVTLLGMMIEVKLAHPQKAPTSMLVTLSPMMTEAKRLHPKNAPFHMLSTLFGMMIDVKLLQSKNAPLPNPVRTPYKIADQINGNLDLIF